MVNLSEDERQITVEVDGVELTPARELISGTEPDSVTLAVDSLGHYLYELAEPIRTCAVTGARPDDQPTVVIRDEDSGVSNYDTGDDCTVNDLIDDERDWPNHGALERHVVNVTDDLVDDEVLTAREQGAIIAAAGRSR